MIKNDAGRVGKGAPPVRAGAPVEDEDRLHPVPFKRELGRVVEDLAETETDPLSLVCSRERFDLGYEQAAPPLPTEIELRSAAVWEVGLNVDRPQRFSQAAHGFLVGRRGPIEGLKVDSESEISPSVGPRA